MLFLGQVVQACFNSSGRLQLSLLILILTASCGVSDITFQPVDDDRSPAAITAGQTINEGSAYAEVRVTLSSASDENVNVTYTLSGTASLGSDFSDPSSGTLSFSPGQTTETLRFPITDDTVYEGNETLILTLSAPSGIVLSSESVHTIKIQDNDTQVLKLSLINADSDLAIAGFDPIPEDAVIDLEKLPSRNLSIRATTSNSAVLSVKFKFGAHEKIESGQPWVLFGDQGTNITGQEIAAGKHTLEAFAYSAAGASGNLLGQQVLRFSVVEGSAAGIIAYEKTVYPLLKQNCILCHASPPNEDGMPEHASANIKVSYDWSKNKSGPKSGKKLVVFQNPALSLIIERSKDGHCGSTCSSNTPLASNLQAAIFTWAEAEGYTFDEPTVSFIEADRSVAEDAGVVQVGLTLSNRYVLGNVTVKYALSGTAVVGSDYTGSAGTLVFTPGEYSKTIPITILRDSVSEAEESLKITLSLPAGSNALAGSVMTHTIRINDVGVYQYLPQRLIRLSGEQYKNTVLRPFASLSTQLGSLNGYTFPFMSEPQVGRYSTDAQHSTIGSSDFQKAYTIVSEKLAPVLAGHFKPLVDACISGGGTRVTCMMNRVQSQAELLYRRPLDSAEVASFTTLLTTASSSNNLVSLTTAFQALFLNPSTFFRSEIGVASPEQGVLVTLTKYEIADFIAYSITNAPPDAALQARVADGSILNQATLAAEVERLLGTTSDRSTVTRFFEEYLDYGTHAVPDRPDPGLSQEFDYPTLKDETDKLVKELVRRYDSNDLFVKIFTTDLVYASKYSAGDFYGINPANVPANGIFVETSGAQKRTGVLTQPSWISGFADNDRTIPTKRGKFIQENLLCNELPKVELAGNIPDLPIDETLTMRQRLSAHVNQESCVSCHAVMDPLGFPLEAFKHSGLVRSTEQGKPVDTSGALQGEGIAAAIVNGADDMFNTLVDMDHALDCFMANTEKYFTGHSHWPSVNKVNPKILRKVYADSGNSFRAVLKAIFSSPLATKRRVEVSP